MEQELQKYKVAWAFANATDQVNGIIKSLRFVISHYNGQRESLESFSQFIKSLTIIRDSLSNLITCQLYEIDSIQFDMPI